MAMDRPHGEQHHPPPEQGPKRYLKPLGGLLAALLGLGVVISPFFFSYAFSSVPAELEAFDAAEALIFDGRYQEALVKINEGIAINPGLSEGYIFRAAVFTAQGQEDWAQADVNRAVRIIRDVRPGDIEREIDRILRRVEQTAGQTD